MNFSNFPSCAPRTVIISAVNLYFSTCLLRIVFSPLVAMCFDCAARGNLFKIHYFY